jgi:hypothetical protein
MRAIEEIRQKLWKGQNPFAQLKVTNHKIDAFSFGQPHHFLIDRLAELKPRVIVEVGVWKGGSTLFMANALRKLQLDAVVISVDTWLGSVEHWENDKWFASLQMRAGYPQLYYNFAANVIQAGLQDYVVPLPLDSVNARELISLKGIACDMLHIDAGHDYASVKTDFAQWWPVLRKGGLYVGDDYHPRWPGVIKATDEFLKAHPHSEFKSEPGKCMAVKG